MRGQVGNLFAQKMTLSFPRMFLIECKIHEHCLAIKYSSKNVYKQRENGFKIEVLEALAEVSK